MDGKRNKRNTMKMPGPPQLSEELREIMPDFNKWRYVFFQIDSVFACAAFLLECIFFVILYFNGLIKMPLERYVFFYLILPSMLNLFILVIAVAIKKRMNKDDMRQNVIPVFALVLISMVISVTHCNFYATLCIYCIPICMTTVFSSKKLCGIVTGISIFGAVISTVKHFLSVSVTSEHILVLSEGAIAVCVLFLVKVVSQALLDMTEGQKIKLANYAKNVKEAQGRAEAANVAKSAFLANMSHEIRTPINAILGMNEMILRESQEEHITEYAGSIQIAGNSLLYLVNDVLDISKIESGKLEIVETIYDTSSFIHDCCSMVAEKAEKKGLEFIINCNPNLPMQLRGDEVRLRQIVTNFSSNAAKYTEKGSITLSVDCGEKDGQFIVIISVKDTGIGIKEENIDSLFSQFTRFDLEKNRNIQGTGLGLAITKQLTDLMNGKIDVESIYGSGTTFTVTLPQQVVDDTPMGDFHQRYHDINRKNTSYQQSFEAPDARIIVVDDVEVNLKVIVNLLKKTKINVDTALSGRECLDMVTKTKYDIIFMDHMMPEMDGVETHKQMKKLENSLNRDTPVIMLTANAISGVREEYLQEGFADYLSKPVLGDKLENMILKFLPENKVHPVSQTEDVKEDNGGMDSVIREIPNNITALQNLYQAYPKIDITKGLAACTNSTDVYITVLKTFAKRARTDELSKYYGQRDTENYKVTVHGVKGASLSTGFSELSEMARTLEFAARDNDWDFINAHHPDFIKEYQKVVDAIMKVFDSGM